MTPKQLEDHIWKLVAQVTGGEATDQAHEELERLLNEHPHIAEQVKNFLSLWKDQSDRTGITEAELDDELLRIYKNIRRHIEGGDQNSATNKD